MILIHKNSFSEVAGRSLEESRFSLLKLQLLLTGLATLCFFSSVAGAQSSSAPISSPAKTYAAVGSDSSITNHAQPGQAYVRPTEKEKLHNFLFDAVGPYPIAGAVVVGAVQQAYGTPPEWGQGWDAYGARVASNFGIALTTTTTRYAVAEALREDTLYYRCGCMGVKRRLGHALTSTLMARHGENGSYEFSIPGLVAPYAGTMTAALGWYPSRFGPKDGFRMGNYNLLSQAAENVALEFLYGGPHTLLGNLHIPGTAAKAAGPGPGSDSPAPDSTSSSTPNSK